MLLAEGLPWGVSLFFGLAFAVLFGGYILYASCKRERPSDRTGEYDS